MTIKKIKIFLDDPRDVQELTDLIMNGDLSDIEDIGLANADENHIDELPVNHIVTRIGQDVMTQREDVEDQEQSQDFTEYNKIAEEQIRIESEEMTTEQTSAKTKMYPVKLILTFHQHLQLEKKRKEMMPVVKKSKKNKIKWSNDSFIPPQIPQLQPTNTNGTSTNVLFPFEYFNRYV
jgi:hypothetical protein